ncbi:MAG: 6-phosphogluconolactonase [Ignavibacteria bacterium]|nr:6-phosphogluconolactonase [Ignavibacteria bacterium]
MTEHIVNYKMSQTIKIFETPELLAESFAEYFANEVSKKKKYNIALSGGSTPKIIFKTLAEKYSGKINWKKVHFFWGDERCVPPSSDESNFKMTKKYLLDKINIPDENIHRIRGEDEPITEAIRYSNEISDLLYNKNSLPCFDFIMLGLGEDGHTASIFPDRLDLFESDKICEAVTNPITLQQRITITGNVINNSLDGAFFITGKEKSNVVAKIINHESGSISLPASKINLTSGNFCWYLDNKSSSLILTSKILP